MKAWEQGNSRPPTLTNRGTKGKIHLYAPRHIHPILRSPLPLLALAPALHPHFHFEHPIFYHL
jgi:hypothetical protein